MGNVCQFQMQWGPRTIEPAAYLLSMESRDSNFRIHAYPASNMWFLYPLLGTQVSPAHFLGFLHSMSCSTILDSCPHWKGPHSRNKEQLWRPLRSPTLGRVIDGSSSCPVVGKLRQAHLYKTQDPSLRPLWKSPYQPNQTCCTTSLSLRFYPHLPSFLPCMMRARLPSEAPFLLHRSCLHWGFAHPFSPRISLTGYHQFFPNPSSRP